MGLSGLAAWFYLYFKACTQLLPLPALGGDSGPIPRLAKVTTWGSHPASGGASETK